MDLNAWFSGQAEYFLLLEVLMLTSAISACRLVGRVHIFEFPLLAKSLKCIQNPDTCIRPKGQCEEFLSLPNT